MAPTKALIRDPCPLAFPAVCQRIISRTDFRRSDSGGPADLGVGSQKSGMVCDLRILARPSLGLMLLENTDLTAPVQSCPPMRSTPSAMQFTSWLHEAVAATNGRATILIPEGRWGSWRGTRCVAGLLLSEVIFSAVESLTLIRPGGAGVVRHAAHDQSSLQSAAVSEREAWIFRTMRISPNVYGFQRVGKSNVLIVWRPLKGAAASVFFVQSFVLTRRCLDLDWIRAMLQR